MILIIYFFIIVEEEVQGDTEGEKAQQKKSEGSEEA